ncbi:unnamed protein product [Rangifer tarandus platyrhynchus]|uniref:Uncharacterized protein n=2 Tax=Rangifer tarandus platyrhynchus TaxID=3082113 RepID=A0ABN8Y0J0_RANTA|nr:unnamed protein product [Rangifer tarandus platyrhynchus]
MGSQSWTGLSTHAHKGLEFLFAKSGSCLETGCTALRAPPLTSPPVVTGNPLLTGNDSPMKILAQRTLASSTTVSMGCVPKSRSVTLCLDSCGQDVRAATP